MGQESPFQFRQDVVDAQYGSGHVTLGPTGGQVAFDFLFGVLAPIALLVADPALFQADGPLFVANRAALPPYWAMPTYIVQGCLIAALLVWGLTGMRSTILGMLLAGPFAAGALLSLVLGGALFWFALGHADLLSGWLAFTPWATAFVFLRHCVLACRAGAHRSVGLTVLFLAASFTALVVGLATLAAARDRRARFLEGLLLSESPADLEYACSQIRHRHQVDMDRVALAYLEMKDEDPRRGRLKAAYLRITGAPIEGALQRLLPPTALTAPQEEKPAGPKEGEPPEAAVLDRLFSTDREEHERAADELTTHSPDPKVLDEVVRRYSQLPEGDPRRGWVERAYPTLNSDGETIQRALKRLGKTLAPAAKGSGPKQPSPRPGTSTSPEEPAYRP